MVSYNYNAPPVAKHTQNMCGIALYVLSKVYKLTFIQENSMVIYAIVNAL